LLESTDYYFTPSHFSFFRLSGPLAAVKNHVFMFSAYCCCARQRRPIRLVLRQARSELSRRPSSARIRPRRRSRPLPHRPNRSGRHDPPPRPDLPIPARGRRARPLMATQRRSTGDAAAHGHRQRFPTADHEFARVFRHGRGVAVGLLRILLYVRPLFLLFRSREGADMSVDTRIYSALDVWG